MTTPLDWYRQMATIRAFEERCLSLAREGVVAGSIHLCHGQEAIPVGAIAALTERDRVLATYRGHGWALACGVPAEDLLAEVCHRAGGVNGGRGGSAYLSSPAHRFVGENSIVGAGAPIADGVALAAKVLDEDRVTLVSLGDGALSQGAVHEALVFAAARELPVIFVCENNGWAEMTRGDAMVRGAGLADRVSGYGIAAEVVDGCDPEAVRDAVARATAWAREGGGPSFLECTTVRLGGHYNRDIEHYRSKEDKQRAALEEPLVRMRRAAGDDQSAFDAVDAEVEHEIDATAQAVLRLPEPDSATLLEHVVAFAAGNREAGRGPATELTYISAVHAALKAELSARPEVVVYGEDVGVAGGIFGASRQLQQEFGGDRVFDTPIAESAILGSAVGAAISGLRPIVEIMWADFLLVALDTLVNQAANVRYLSSGRTTAPLVVRTQQGITPGSTAQHSQSLEAMLAHVPGLKVGLPSTPQDAYAMLRAAAADPDPCVLFESRALYPDLGSVHLDAPTETIGGARLRRSGADAVLISWGAAVKRALEAAEMLAKRGVEVSVLDLRWLRPLDVESIERTVRAAGGRVGVVHDAPLTGGFGAEISALVHERVTPELAPTVIRLGGADAPVPSAPSLQAAAVPSADVIAARLSQLLDRADVA